MKLKLALAFLTAAGIGAATRIATLPPFDPTADVGKVPVIGVSGTVSWSTASAVSGAVVGTSGPTGNLPYFIDGTGKRVGNSGIPSANVVLVSRSVQAGTGLQVTNSGLLSADITMSLTTPVTVANGGIGALNATSGFTNLSPQTTKGDLIGYSTLPVRVALGSTGQQLTPDAASSVGLSWVMDRTGTSTGDTACSGCVGQTLFISRVASAATGVATNTTFNVATTQSISVTPGDWQICGAVVYSAGGATSYTQVNAAVSKTSSTLPGGDTTGVPTAGEVLITQSSAATVPGSGQPFAVLIPCFRSSFATTTSLFLIGRATFTVSTSSSYGYLEARRMR